ncbi:MAG: permease, partial [Parachlamydiaceae bacterium]
MNKEPLGLYFLRLFLMTGLLILVGMVYWSSLLVEERVNAIYQDVSALKKSISNFKPAVHQDAFVNPGKAAERHVGDDAYPNLLVEDYFYTKTLPEMLGKNFSPKGIFQEATVGRPINLHPFNNWAEVSGWHGQCSVTLAQLAFGFYDRWVPCMATKIEARPRQDYDSPEAVEYWVHLRSDVYWQPIKPQFFSGDIALAPIFQEKHPVTAYDFAFYYHALMNPHVEEAGAIAARSLYEDIESITAIDPQTLVVRWKVHEVTDSSGKKSYKIKYVAESLTAGLSPLPSHVFQRFADGSNILEPETPLEAYQTNPVWAQNFS